MDQEGNFSDISDTALERNGLLGIQTLYALKEHCNLD